MFVKQTDFFGFPGHIKLRIRLHSNLLNLWWWEVQILLHRHFFECRHRVCNSVFLSRVLTSFEHCIWPELQLSESAKKPSQDCLQNVINLVIVLHHKYRLVCFGGNIKAMHLEQSDRPSRYSNCSQQWNY